MKKQNPTRYKKVHSLYVNQALNINGLVDPVQFYLFTEELSSEEYLILDYLIYQRMTLAQAAQKIEVSLYRAKVLLECICNKAKIFVSKSSVIIDHDDSYEKSSNGYYDRTDSYINPLTQAA
tara:strand:- start:521 stop:886 length:366 start_codon:yes stop_codon:yes gene_type:complete